MNLGSQSPSDCYKSIASPSKGIFKDKGSKFLAFAYPVETEDEIKAIVAGIKKEYFDARHHCYAWRLGHLGDKWRANDDGEPSSTAGKPILGQIVSNNLSDILIVVVRYFGGILLGTSGLINAYKSASAEAIAAATVVEKVATVRYRICFDYAQMNAVMKCLKDFRLSPMNTIFDNQCSLEVDIRLSTTNSFTESIRDKCIRFEPEGR
ncbi:MAG: YigZ family protein [Bacteroidales bacterium]|nr:YigZ family protein [Bacteroidales bacterium]